MKQDLILILDLGSKDNSRLARAVRALGVYSEIHAHDITAAELASLHNVKGIILNGGDNNKVDGQTIRAGEHIFEFGVPVMAIDYDAPSPYGVDRMPGDDDDALLVMLKSFVFDVCGAEANWNTKNFVSDQIELIKRQVGDKRVLLALSGGVDSSVVAALLVKAIGIRLQCVHVNHGLMRKNESEEVVEVFRNQLGANLVYVDATDRFLDRLAGVADPETKRKIIGEEFIRVFEEEAQKFTDIEFLAQGTIYPDIVESGTKTSKTVKSHHNVGGLPENLGFKLIEPLKFLFKDEVRAVGRELGLPDSMVYRQPFPGPGLGVRCLGVITRERLAAVRESDAILREEFELAGLSGRVWQYFTLIPDVTSTGVKDGGRVDEWPVIIRAVNTVDAMTAAVPSLDWGLLQKITNRILDKVPGVNRVLFDLSPKPPATIEWE